MKKMVPAVSLTVLVLLGVYIGLFLNRSTTIVLAGDILLDRGVREKLTQNGYAYPYAGIKDELRKADIAFGNLECPITVRGIPALKKNTLLFRADRENAAALKNAGFDIVNLANNHTMDYGREGMRDTMEALDKAGIIAVGAGEDRDSAHQPVYIKRSGVVIGFLGFSAFPTEGYFYFEDRPDVSQVVLEDLAGEVRAAKSKCDFLIVSFHWGREYDYYPVESQKEAAHIALESGADVIAGHHPHVLQSVEMYLGKPVFYSLGNFVFDRQEPVGTDETILLKLKLKGKKLNKIEIEPLKIVECQPVKPDADSGRKILERLILYSEGMNAEISLPDGGGYAEVRERKRVPDKF